jgi:hypothetical protein
MFLSRRLRLRGPLAACTLAAALTICSVAVAKPAVGTYNGTSGFEFSFNIEKGRCPSAPDPNDPNARPGPRKHGLCFQPLSVPEIPMTCPAPAKLVDTPSLPIDVRLSAKGKLLSKTVKSVPPPSGTSFAPTEASTELSLKVKGNKASGWVETTGGVYANGNAVVCTSGQQPFTATLG